MLDYNHIKNFLEEFKKIIFQKEELKIILAKTISEQINFDIGKTKIKIKGNIIYVEGSSVLKSEILIHKKNILNKINNYSTNTKFFDIR